MAASWPETIFVNNAPAQHILSTKWIQSWRLPDTGSTATACLEAPRHFKIFRCDADIFYSSKAMPSNVEMFARQLFYVDPSIIETQGTQKTAKRNLPWKTCALKSLRKDVWRAPRRMNAVQVFLHHPIFMWSRYIDSMDIFTGSSCRILYRTKNGGPSASHLTRGHICLIAMMFTLYT